MTPKAIKAELIRGGTAKTKGPMVPKKGTRFEYVRAKAVELVDTKRAK